MSSLLKAVITAFPSVSLPFLAVPLLSQGTLVAISGRDRPGQEPVGVLPRRRGRQGGVGRRRRAAGASPCTYAAVGHSSPAAVSDPEPCFVCLQLPNTCCRTPLVVLAAGRGPAGLALEAPHVGQRWRRRRRAGGAVPSAGGDRTLPEAGHRQLRDAVDRRSPAAWSRARPVR
eukprot:SAG22_NODE_1638_length_3912_cov_5.771046_3_plen_173_part_00